MSDISQISDPQSSVSFAPEPGRTTVRFKWLAARVSGHVQSQTKQRPIIGTLSIIYLCQWYCIMLHARVVHCVALCDPSSVA